MPGPDPPEGGRGSVLFVPYAFQETRTCWSKVRLRPHFGTQVEWGAHALAYNADT